MFLARLLGMMVGTSENIQSIDKYSTNLLFSVLNFTPALMVPLRGFTKQVSWLLSSIVFCRHLKL